MSTTPTPVTMIDPNGEARAVPADGAAQASQAGWKPATKMVDPQGTPRWIPADGADDAKLHGYVLHPDSMKPSAPTKADDTSERGEFGTAALPKGYKGNPNYGALATDEEVDARARQINASLTPEQKRALGISDRIENAAGNTLLAAGVAGNAAVAAPAAAPIITAAARGAAPIVGKQAAKYVATGLLGGTFELGRELIAHWVKGMFK